MLVLFHKFDVVVVLKSGYSCCFRNLVLLLLF